jgi:hypothetical protein
VEEQAHHCLHYSPNLNPNPNPNIVYRGGMAAVPLVELEEGSQEVTSRLAGDGTIDEQGNLRNYFDNELPIQSQKHKRIE